MTEPSLYKYNHHFTKLSIIAQTFRRRTHSFLQSSRLCHSLTMHFTQVLALASSAALVAAAPAPITLGVDDVILYGKDGRFKMMKRGELEEIKELRESGVAPPKPGYLDNTLVTLPANETGNFEGSLKERATSIVIPNPHFHFLGWDVQTSQVVKGTSSALER